MKNVQPHGKLWCQAWCSRVDKSRTEHQHGKSAVVWRLDRQIHTARKATGTCVPQFWFGFFFGRFLRSSYAKQAEQCYTLTWHPTRKDSQRFLWDIFSFNAECFGKWMGKRAKQLHEPRRPHTEQERAAVLDPAAKSAQGYTLTIHCRQLKSPLKGMKKEN